MTSALPTQTYLDPEFERAHQATFASHKGASIKRVLPPGVQQGDFERALKDFAAAVGDQQVFVRDALAHYIDPYDIYEKDESKRKVPSAAVCPGSVDELREILRVSNKYGIPLWTFSRGKNLGYGGPAPRLNGSVALDLHRMNKILEVNDEHGYAVVEPGVTFQELYQYCVDHDKKVWPSTPSLGWGSVTGNTLDRGTGFGQNSNHHQCIAGLEVMLADGDVVRTGQYGISNSPSAFLSKFTFGPSIEGLFLQSNLGVVTKLSMWLAPRPPAFISCTFSVPEEDDIGVLVDAFGEMRRSGLIQNVVWVGNFIERLCLRGRRSEMWSGQGPIPDWRLKELQRELNEGFWTATWGLYGPKEVVEAQLSAIRTKLREAVPQGTLDGTLYASEPGKPLDAKSIPPEHGLFLVGVPSLFSLSLMDWALPASGGKAAHGDYAPIIPSSGKAILDWTRTCKLIHAAAGIDYMADFFMHERHVIFTSMYAYDQQNPQDCKNVEQLYSGMHEASKKRGYGMYRAHVHHMDMIADLNDFNDHAYKRFVEKLKDPRRRKLPPGPPGLPFIGNLLQLRDAESVRDKVRKWHRKYGDVFYTKIGGTDYVWLSSPKAVKDLMDKKSSIYSSRPHLPLAQEVASGNSRQLFMPYGPDWRSLRKHSHALLNQNSSRKYQPVQDFESKVVLRDLLEEPGQYYTISRRYSTSVIMLVAYGRRIPSFQDPLITKIFGVLGHVGLAMAPGAFAVESFPSLAALPEFLLGNWRSLGQKWFVEDSKVYLDLWNTLKKKTDEGTAADCFCKDFYISDPKKHGINDLLAAYTCGGLIEAGSETTATTINNWYLAMTLYPEEMRKGQEELDRVVGPDRLPTWDDEKDLPFLRAMIKETLRWRPVNKYGMYHASTQDDWYEDHFIPKDSVVVLNWWAIHRDPNLHPDPDTFKPSRYLSRPLSAAEYMNSQDPYERDHFTYGAGRRSCPGVHLAEKSLFIVISRVLWGFNIRKKMDAEGHPIEPTTRMLPGFFSVPEPFECDIICRSEMHERIMRREFEDAMQEGLHYRR
ncbi:hypothetical protein ACJZ2D_008621 [Fusarium nematophilum]